MKCKDCIDEDCMYRNVINKGEKCVNEVKYSKKDNQYDTKSGKAKRVRKARL